MTAVLSRLFPSTSGAASPTAYSGPVVLGVALKMLGPKIQWLTGYWDWVPAGGDLIPIKHALWAETSSTTAQLVPGSVVTSGTLIAGQWNFTALPAPIPLSLGTAYVAARGWTAVNGFPITAQQWGSVAPATYKAGLTSGNLYAYSDGTNGGTGTVNPTIGGVQNAYSFAGADPSVTLPNTGSNSSAFGGDIQVSDTAPAGYTGSYSLFPANVIGNQDVAADLNDTYNVGTDFALAAACPLQAIRYLSPSGATQLATRASVWSVDSTGLVRLEIPAAVLAAPSWSGAAGSGWVQASFASPPVLPAGKYVAAVYNEAASGTGTGWNAKDSITGAWETGDFASGVQNGPLSAPGQSAASVCYDYNGSAPGAAPPYSAGTTEPGQNPFGQLPTGSTPGAPYLYSGPSQNYFIDVVIGQPVTSSSIVPLIAATGGR